MRTIELLVGETAVVNLQMAPSTIQESLTVTGEAPLVDTASSAVGANIDPRQMASIPLNGRRWTDLTLLAPGSRNNVGTDNPSSSQGQGTGFQLNLDGQQVTNTVVGGAGFGQPQFSRDAIGEFEFISNRFDATQGRSSGVQVNAITKSGTNTLAGTFAGYFRDDKFNAADPVTKTVLPYQDQQLSATFGGPIIKNRVHYFLSYEFERSPQTFVYTTPYPSFNGSLSGTGKDNKTLGRFDIQFSPKLRLMVRADRFHEHLPYDYRYTGGSTFTRSGALEGNKSNDQLFANMSQILGNSVVNQISGGHSFNYFDNISRINNPNTFVGQLPGFGTPIIQLRGLTIGQAHPNAPQILKEDYYSVRDDLSLSVEGHGRHTIKTGAEFMRPFTVSDACVNCMGILDAMGGPIPSNIESFFPSMTDPTTWNLAPLSSIARSYTRNIANPSGTQSRPTGTQGFTTYIPRRVFAGWFQDDWAVAKKLTLNLGVRYDVDYGGYAEWVDLRPFLTPGRQADKNNWAPRLGAAYKLTDKSVIRGGFGKYFPMVFDQPGVWAVRYADQVALVVQNDGRPDFASNPFNGAAPTWEQALALRCDHAPDPKTSLTCIRSSVSSIPSNGDQVPYSYQASAGFERQLGAVMALEADYLFAADRAILQTRNTNLAFDVTTGRPYPLVGAAANANIPNRPFPGWFTTQQQMSDGKANTHSVQVALTKRMSNRWQGSGSYSWTRSWQFDSLPLNPGCPNPMTISAAGQPVCNVPVTIPTELGENAWYRTGVQQNRFTFNGIWEAGYGFQLSAFYVFGDNGFGTPTSGVDVYNIGNSGTRRLANGALIPRNSFDLPSIQKMDARVQKRFPIGGKATLDGIFEVFNVFNHANFDPTLYTLNEASAKFGQPNASTVLGYQPRMLQLGFRAAF